MGDKPVAPVTIAVGILISDTDTDSTTNCMCPLIALEMGIGYCYFASIGNRQDREPRDKVCDIHFFSSTEQQQRRPRNSYTCPPPSPISTGDFMHHVISVISANIPLWSRAEFDRNLATGHHLPANGNLCSVQ